MDKEKVLKLSKLSRLDISEKEAENLSHEFESILSYVSEVKSVKVKNDNKISKDDYPVRNILRTDDNSHESGIYSQKILEQAPAKEAQYIKVKKIL